ncbi:exonuclease domain-containing protein [Eupransor demetentiae]|uniref:Alpha subunit (Gram-positive type) (PolC) n=1 Tax=Eupransor demetentiae TaxID=3109584 RepID=A0ABM9N4I7_9LACO|nr:DNA polymerase III [Lactobacillaceae bacterium LMG 33000]
MQAKDSFVVVDLETTGPSVAKGGRIIQIGMTFIKNRKIVEHFDSFVNPGQNIDRQIQQLTHIRPKDVRNAPYFEELVSVLRSLLEGQIFVAHNVNFDYPYLNEEMKRLGFPPLDLVAIDTVQLAQILLPQAPGYRLTDLTNYLKLPLNNAHRANADAQATALLLLELWQRAAALPKKVQTQLESIDWGLLRQSQDFLKMAMHSTVLPEKKPDQDEIKSTHSFNNNYPMKLSQKATQLGQEFEKRPQQNHLMNQIYNFVSKPKPGILQIASQPKMGKTLAYLLPLYYQKAAWPSLLLTDDWGLMHQQVTLLNWLNQTIGGQLSWALLDLPENYLDFAKFKNSLKEARQNGGHIWQARLLVWLNHTQTGNLREIPVGIARVAAWRTIRGSQNSRYFQAAWQKALQADVIMMSDQGYWQLSDSLLNKRQLKKWPLVVLERPINFFRQMESAFNIELDLNNFPEDYRDLLNKEVRYSKRQTGQIKKHYRNLLSARDGLLKLIGKPAELVGQTKAFLQALLTLQKHLQSSGASSNFGPQEAEKILEKIKFCQKNPEYLRPISPIEGDDGQVRYKISLDLKAIYQKAFIEKLQRLVIMADYLPQSLGHFLTMAPEEYSMQKSAVPLVQPAVNVIQPERYDFMEHLTALLAAGQQKILILQPDRSGIQTAYQSIKRTYGDDYNVVAQDITAPLAKLKRQYHDQSNMIMIVDSGYMKTLWQQTTALPAVVMIPDSQAVDNQGQLKEILIALQSHPISLCLLNMSPKELGPVRRQVRILKDGQEDLIAFYQELFEFDPD